MNRHQFSPGGRCADGAEDQAGAGIDAQPGGQARRRIAQRAAAAGGDWQRNRIADAVALAAGVNDADRAADRPAEADAVAVGAVGDGDGRRP